MTDPQKWLATDVSEAAEEQDCGERPSLERRPIEVVIRAIKQEAATRGYSGSDVSPHEFEPLQRWRNRGRCKWCMCHEEMHPALGWLPARPMFDRGEAIRA